MKRSVQTGNVRFVINAVFARGDENVVFFSGFVVRKGNDLGVEFVDRKIFTDEDNFLYAVLAERRVAEIEKTGEAARPRRRDRIFLRLPCR